MVRLLNFIFQITLFIYGCLFVFEDMTSTMVICGIVSQIVHLTLLQSFPFFALTSPQFILAAGKTDLIGYGKHSLKIWIFELLVLIFYLIFSDGCHEPLFGVSVFCWELPSFFRGKFVVHKLLLDWNIIASRI